MAIQKFKFVQKAKQLNKVYLDLLKEEVEDNKCEIKPNLPEKTLKLYTVIEMTRK